MFTQILRIFQFKRPRRAALLCGTTVFLLVGNMSISAKASPQRPVSVEAQISLGGASSMMLGEPIILRYKITNVSDGQGVGIGLGTYKTRWCRLRLTDAEGNSAQVIPDSRPLSPRGLHSTGTFFLRPDGSEEDSLVVSRFFQILHNISTSRKTVLSYIQNGFFGQKTAIV